MSEELLFCENCEEPADWINEDGSTLCSECYESIVEEWQPIKEGQIK